MTSFDTKMKSLKTQFDVALENEVARWDKWPKLLVEACRHVLFGGGKRVRPLVGLMIAESFGSRNDVAIPWAIAIELIHTYSLVHDDLPAMDDDDVRRGRPTCHIKYGEANAILAGDAMLTQAFGVIGGAPGWSDAQKVRLNGVLAQAAGGGGMVGGQVHDISGDMKDLTAVLHMQALKTGALIRASSEGAAIAAGAREEQSVLAARFGSALGLLFQLTDDILDKEQDLEEGGNNVLHHIDENRVRDRITEVAEAAYTALAEFPGDTSALRDFVNRIVHRTV